MKDVFAKCGFNCGRCPAYKENAKTDKDRKRGSDGWKKYYGFQIRLDRMYCDGCQTPDEKNPVLLAPFCTMRKCAIKNGVKTCAHCSAYQVCMHELRIGPDIDRNKVEARIGSPVPEEGYLAFIEPFENLKHLDKIRASLKPEDRVDAVILTVKPRVAGFPSNLPFSRREKRAYEPLYRLLANVASLSGSTYAQKEALKKRKQYMFTLLWMFGLSGEFKKENGSHFKIDSETYLAQKLTYEWRKMELSFEMLKKYGVFCEVIPVTEEEPGKKEWVTPMGWLRQKGWLLRMTFDGNAGGASALKALKNYVIRLDREYGKKAFRYFRRVDMQVLTREET